MTPALLTIAALVVGFLAGRTQGAIEEKRRITKLLTQLSSEADREHRVGWNV